MTNEELHSFVSHEKKADGSTVDVYHCKECDFYSTKFQGLVGHLQKHTLETFKCDLCKKSFRKPKAYLNHRIKVHKETNPKVPKTRRTATMHIGERPDGTLKPPKPYVRKAKCNEPTTAGPIPITELARFEKGQDATLEVMEPKAMALDMDLMMAPLKAFEEAMNHEPSFVVEDTVMKHLCTKCNAHHDYDIPGMKHCNLCGGELKQITYKHIRLV